MSSKHVSDADDTASTTSEPQSYLPSVELTTPSSLPSTHPTSIFTSTRDSLSSTKPTNNQFMRMVLIPYRDPSSLLPCPSYNAGGRSRKRKRRFKGWVCSDEEDANDSGIQALLEKGPRYFTTSTKSTPAKSPPALTPSTSNTSYGQSVKSSTEPESEPYDTGLPSSEQIVAKQNLDISRDWRPTKEVKVTYKKRCSGSRNHQEDEVGEDFGVEEYDVKEQNVEKHRVDKPQVDEHNVEVQIVGDHTAGEHNIDEHLGDEHKLDEDKVGEHLEYEHGAKEHKAEKHKAEEHKARDDKTHGYMVEAHEASSKAQEKTKNSHPKLTHIHHPLRNHLSASNSPLLRQPKHKYKIKGDIFDFPTSPPKPKAGEKLFYLSRFGLGSRPLV